NKWSVAVRSAASLQKPNQRTKGIEMRTTSKARGFGVSLALALAAVLALSSRAADQMKGAQILMMKQVKTPAEVEALKPGDAITMVCTKCKSVMVHNVSTEKGHIKVMTVGEKHLCPGCEGTITVVGTGKGKHDEVKHACAKCGNDSVFCCATKPGTGKTDGMEKH